MTGLIFKELRMNRTNLILIALMGPGMVLLWLGFGWLMTLNGNAEMRELIGSFNSADGTPPLLYLMCAFTPFFATGLQAFLNISQDEVKKWAYFTASHPKGIRGAIYSKYVVTFLMLMVAYVSAMIAAELVVLADHLLVGTENAQLMINLQITNLLSGGLFFFQLFKMMIDFPFTYRFGKKNGEQMKVLTFGILVLGGLIYLLFGPLPGGEDGDPIVALYDWCVSFANGTLKHNIYLILGVILWIVIIGYYVSYRISCKVYMKGAEQYAK